MSKETLCNDGRCKRVRMGEEKHSNHDNPKKEPKRWINAEKAIKNMKKITIGFIVIAIVVGILIQIIFDPPLFLLEKGVTPLFSQDGEEYVPLNLLNITTLSAEIIFGTFIALIVYVYSKRQQEENTKITNNMKNSVTKVQKIIEEQENLRIEKKEIGEQRLSAYFEFISIFITNKEDAFEIKNSAEQLRMVTLENESIKEYASNLDRVIDNYSDVLVPEDIRKTEILSLHLQSYTDYVKNNAPKLLVADLKRHLEDLREKYPPRNLDGTLAE